MSEEKKPKFKSKTTVSVMLAGVVCSSVFLAISEYIQGRPDWAEWMYPIIIGVIGLVFVLCKRPKKEGEAVLSETGIKDNDGNNV